MINIIYIMLKRSISLEDIIKCAFNSSITNDDINMIEKCLIKGATVTSTSIEKLNELILNYNYGYNIKPVSNNIFKLLLKNGFDVITDNVKFMYSCVLVYDEFYIKSIIDMGYNGDNIKAPMLLQKIIKKPKEVCHIDILLDNGFCKHIQSLLMHTITGSSRYLSLFIIRGANCYSILNDLLAYVLLLKNINDLVYNNINIMLKHMYDIKNLNEPVLKYFLIKSINYDVPNDILISICVLYMEIDYAKSNVIKEDRKS